MIRGEYNARQAFEAFDARLRQSGDASSDIVLTLEKGYSNIFHKDGGNEAYSVMAHTMREMYGCDVILAFGDSYTGSVFQADYSKKMVGNMVMPNALVSFSREMSCLSTADHMHQGLFTVASKKLEMIAAEYNVNM